jgi:hypothetical protein
MGKRENQGFGHGIWADKIPFARHRFAGMLTCMNWRQFIPVIIVLGVAMIFVWRSSGKKTGCGCGDNCAHDPTENKKKETAAR